MPAESAAAAHTTSPAAPARSHFASLRDQLPWLALALGAVLAAGVAYAHMSRLEFQTHGQLLFGWAAAAGYLSAYAYSARKRWGLRRFSRLRPWYLGHVWLTTTGFVVALMHADFGFGGSVEAAALVGFGLVLGSGFLLAAYQRAFTRWMVRIEDEHLLPEDILDARQRLTTEAAELMAAHRKTGPVVRAHVLEPLDTLGARWAAFRGGDTAATFLSERQQVVELEIKKLNPEQKEVVRRLLEGQMQLRNLEVQTLLHRLRVTWVSLHMVLSAAVLMLLFIHLGLVMYY